MPEIPKQILELARNQHRQASTLEKRALSAVRRRMAQAAERVEKRLEQVDDESFAAQQARITLLLERIVQAETEAELANVLEQSVGAASQLGPAHTGDQLSKWLEHYGHEARPINLAAVANLSESILVERIPRSLERWGPQVAKRMRDELAIAAAGRLDREKTVDAIHKTIDAERWQADRIVRTETSEAYNASHEASLHYAAENYDVDDGLKKSAIATFDGRTDQDSYPVHGQVVELDGNFEDGDGRRYPHPPGRPNDREKEIAWMEESAALIMDREEGIAQSEEAKGLDMDEAARRKRREARAERRARLRLESAARGKTFEERRSQLAASWVHGSHNERAVEMKTAVAENFGVPGVVYDKRDLKLKPENVEETTGDLRRIYEDTQRQYQEAGVTHVDLYRGVKTEVDDVGVVESWTTDLETAEKFDGHTVIKERVDVRRIMWHHQADGWRNGKYGEQFEHLVLTDIPEHQWEARDFGLGGFNASEAGSNPERASHWGLVNWSDDDARAALVHRPSGREVLTGRYSRDTLKKTALELDRRGYVDSLGRLPDDAGERDEFEELVAGLAQDAQRQKLAERARDLKPLEWDSDDYRVVGGLKASEFGVEPERAGVWGIVEKPGREGVAPGAVLEHVPSGQVVLEGSYSREQLRKAAAELDKFVEGDGRYLPGDDSEHFDLFVADVENARRFYGDPPVVDGFSKYVVDEKVKVGEETRTITAGGGWGAEVPLGQQREWKEGKEYEQTRELFEVHRKSFDYTNVDRYVDVGGMRFPAINDDVDPGPDDTWSTRVARVLKPTADGSGSFEVEEFKGYTQKNFFIYKTRSTYESANGYEVSDWHIVHKPSGVELHSGVAMPVSESRGGMDVGGWRAFEFKGVAEKLEGYLDEQGNVKEDSVDSWLDDVLDLETQFAPRSSAADARGIDPQEFATNLINTRARPLVKGRSLPELDPSDEERAEWEANGASIDEADERGIGEEDDLEDLPF